ncbi:hypothetical protein GW17_00041704 [Ensete ventricosum]|uniref:Uncharacterized protein n=1 Tax=Ensete ventricosum TaxID=4639 RepID=A0A426YLL0_ENSVE|nr:hypothetical protein B296_00050370 [Ensete ventricosum]RWV95657.1 hypothetical protein GW17_00041704 [Ensete ventricosum]RZS20517.1 hypothetical protein BHM03_00053041 [Ensete ventricosum]
MLLGEDPTSTRSYPRLSFRSLSTLRPPLRHSQTLVHDRGSNTIDGGLPAIHKPTPSSPRSETFPQVNPPPNPSSRLGRRSPRALSVSSRSHLVRILPIVRVRMMVGCRIVSVGLFQWFRFDEAGAFGCGPPNVSAGFHCRVHQSLSFR